MINSLAVHVIDQDSRQRAQISRAVIAAGHHAEIYSSVAELKCRPPDHGVILAAEDDLGCEMMQLEASLRGHGKWLGIIVTTTDPSIEKAVVAIRDGAMDYLPWPVEHKRLGWAIERAASTTLRNQQRYAKWNTARERLEVLTAREQQVLALVADGFTNRAIGVRLGISVRTVEIHRINAIKKLGVSSTAEAIIAHFIVKNSL